MKRMNSGELARAYAKGIPFGSVYKCHNAYATDAFYRLHGNVLVEKLSPHHVKVDPCGWHTVTTQRHINNVLSALGYHKKLSRRELFKDVIRHSGRIKEGLQVKQWPINLSDILTAEENFKREGWAVKTIHVTDSPFTIMEILRRMCYAISHTDIRLSECLYADLWLAQEQEEIPVEYGWNSRPATDKDILLAYKESAYAL